MGYCSKKSYRRYGIEKWTERAGGRLYGKTFGKSALTNDRKHHACGQAGSRDRVNRQTERTGKQMEYKDGWGRGGESS
jgi:hypothetical protein